jgi:hypothetical protein
MRLRDLVSQVRPGSANMVLRCGAPGLDALHVVGLGSCHGQLRRAQQCRADEKTRSAEGAIASQRHVSFAMVAIKPPSR